MNEEIFEYRTCIAMDEECKQKLVSIAAKTGISASGVVRELIMQHKGELVVAKFRRNRVAPFGKFPGRPNTKRKKG